MITRIDSPVAGVELWLADRDAVGDSLRHLLSPDELARADRFVFPADRVRFAASRGVLRRLLGGLLGLSAGRVRLTAGRHGKPASADDPELRFNLSHSGPLALYAIGRGREVGVDVEVESPMADCLATARLVFTPAELRELEATSGDDRLRRFYRRWVAKEAYIKAVGTGFATPPATFAVAIDHAGPVRLVGADAAKWAMAHFRPAAGAVAAVAVEAGPGRAV